MKDLGKKPGAKFIHADNFDEEENLIVTRTKSKKAVYHSGISDRDVHVIVPSSVYARRLICSGENVGLGERIFEKVLSLQDRDPESATYGLWPYYLEEKLENMDEPDKNMAGFNAREILTVLYKNPDPLSQSIKDKMFDAIAAACSAIIKRNEGVQYTNVAFMESYVLCCAGELTGNGELTKAGRDKLKKSLGFIYYQGSVFEHNSSCYSFLCVRDLGSIVKYVKDREAAAYAAEINKYIWSVIAEHFDYNTLQLGGPQCRAYEDFLPKDNLELIMSACGLYENYKKHPLAPKKLKIIETDAVCPEEYIPYFSGEKVWESSRRIIMRGFNYPHFAFSQAIYHYRGDGFTLGTFNREELWNQRRPLLSYINGKKTPYCFRVKCIHDGFDFSSAVLHAVQKDGKVLGNINFSSDRGDTHIGLDPVKNATIEAEDLRIVFEISGDTEDVNYRATEKNVEITVGNVPIRIADIYTRFGDFPIRATSENNDKHLRYSIILYNGEKRKINLAKLEEAICVFTVEMGQFAKNSKCKTVASGRFLRSEWTVGKDKLALETLRKAEPFKNNMYEDKQYINGTELFRYLDGGALK